MSPLLPSLSLSLHRHPLVVPHLGDFTDVTSSHLFSLVVLVPLMSPLLIVLYHSSSAGAPTGCFFGSH
ncbi:hypothetical protein U1Q18_033019, partial [Sarracenia purpurea var. burkii]